MPIDSSPVIETAAHLRKLQELVLPQLSGEPRRYAAWQFALLEREIRNLVAPEIRIDTSCDACQVERAIVRSERGAFCGSCAESILGPEMPDPRDEQRGSTCSPGCGWCGACS